MRKQDPGELFDWPRLVGAGIGFWPDFTDLPPAPKTIADLQTALATIGYGVPVWASSMRKRKPRSRHFSAISARYRATACRTTKPDNALRFSPVWFDFGPSSRH
jgi:N-acetyl-anhydromuramyl-L-alanine amidase AmpD